MTDTKRTDILKKLKQGLSADAWQEKVRILLDVQSAFDFGLNTKQTDAAIELLDSYLNDAKWEVRRAALFALNASNDKKAKKHLKKCLADNNRWVRQTAEKLLENFTAYPPIVKEDPIRNFVFSLVKDRDMSSLTPEELYQIAIMSGNKFYEELASDTFHEVFNAATPMLGYIQRLRKHLTQKNLLDAESKKTIAKIEQQFDKVYKMLQNLKEFSLEYAEDFEEVVLLQILNEALEQAQGKSKMHAEIEKIRVKMDVTEEIVITGNKEQLVVMFANLMTNSFEAMAKGGRLKITAGIHKDFVEVEISDTGSGFDEDKTEILMKRFKTTKKKIGGTGLGLPIAKKAAENHNGELILKSKKGAGTTATVRLPVERNGND
jgi:signal transduction histidine kinase